MTQYTDAISYVSGLAWNDELCSEIRELDAQHEQLLELWQNLYAAVENGDGPAQVTVRVQELYDFADYHFGREESLMELAGYPHYEEHKKIHVEKLESLGALIPEVRANGLTLEKTYVLAKWVENHIQTVDKDLATFFKTGGKT